MRPSGGSAIIHANRTISYTPGGDAVSNIPVFDLNGDGQLIFIAGPTIRTVSGQRVSGWTGPRFGNGYVPAVGDVFGDGRWRSSISSTRGRTAR